MSDKKLAKRLAKLCHYIPDRRGVDFTEAVKQLHLKKIRKVKMIGRDVVIRITKREGRGSNLAVRDSAGNSVDIPLSVLIDARWDTTDEFIAEEVKGGGMRLSFEMALAYLKQGKMVKRATWRNWAIRLKDGHAIIMCKSENKWVDATGKFVTPTMSEILSEDWEVVE